MLMAAAAVWGVLQLFALSSLTRSVRLSTVLGAFAVGVYGCGVVAALVELAYTRLYAGSSGESLLEVMNLTSYTVAPWVEELLKVTPLLLVGLHAKARRQCGLTDFVVLGAALGAGFGLLEAMLRFSLDARRAIARPDGGWVVPDSLSPPYVPGWSQVLTGWLPAPFASLDMVQAGPTVAATFSHLVWTAVAGLGVGLLLRTRRGWRLLSLLPFAVAVACHTVNNYAAQHPAAASAGRWVQGLDAKAWAAPLVCIVLSMTYDMRQLRRAKRTVPGVLLATEGIDGDSVAALIRYAAWRPPFSTLVALRFTRLRRSLLYAAAVVPPDDTEPLRRMVAPIAARIDASDHADAWRTVDIRAQLKAVRNTRRRWLILIPCLLALPALIFLGVGSFKPTAGLQDFFTTGSGPSILRWFATAALTWILWQLTHLLRSRRAIAAQPLGEFLILHRFRLATALGAATTGMLLLHRSADVGPGGDAIRTFHLLEALDRFQVYLGFALLLLSVLALLFPPGAGFALAFAGESGSAALVGITLEAALKAGALGMAGVLLMAAGAEGGNASSGDNGSSRSGRDRSTDPSVSDAVGSSREKKVAEITNGTIPSGAPGKPGLKVTQPNAGTTDVDVIGSDGSYIAVGGPAKAKDLAKFGQKTHILKWAAEQQGVRAQMYLEKGTPESVLNLARKILGNGNVHTFMR